MREVTINGKTVKLETGLPLPPHKFGREKGDLRLLLEAMKNGESVFLPIPDGKKITQTLNQTGKAVGARFSYRTEGDGIRVYRLAGSPQTRANGAAQPIRRHAIEQRTGAWV